MVLCFDLFFPVSRELATFEMPPRMRTDDKDISAQDSADGREASAALSALVAASVFTVYSSTRFMGVPGGDSGELMAMACQRGVAHPPGYPLLTILGSMWLDLCPDAVGEGAAAKLSLLSALMGSCCAALLALSGATCSTWWGGLLTGCIYAFSPTVWRFSTQFEVFALNNLFAAALLYLSIGFLRDMHRHRFSAYFGAAICGLGLTNQQTLVLLEGPLIVGMLVASKGTLLQPARFAALTLLFTLGLGPYVYLPLAGASPARGSWGSVDNWHGFVRHVTRQEYGSFQVCSSCFGPPFLLWRLPCRAVSGWGGSLVEAAVWQAATKPPTCFSAASATTCSLLHVPSCIFW